MYITDEQRRLAKRVDRALNAAGKAGLSIRCFGRLLLVTDEHLNDPRYCYEYDMDSWMNEAIAVGLNIPSDGGAGV